MKKPKGMNPYTGEPGPPKPASEVQYGGITFYDETGPCEACAKKDVEIATYKAALKHIAEVDIIQSNEYTVERMDYIKTIAWIQSLAKTVLKEMEEK